MKTKKIITNIFLIFILIIAVIIGYLYFNTGLFKSNKTLFIKSLSNIEIIDKNIIQRYNDLTENINKSNYSSTGVINCSLVENNNETNINNIQKLFDLKYNTLKNRNLNQDYADLTLNSNNEDIATIRFIKDNNIYGLKIENVLRKYLAVENTNLKSLFSKLGFNDTRNIPDTISYSNIKEIINFSDEELAKIKDTYLNLAINSIDTNKFSKVKNSKDTVTLNLTLTEKEVADIIIKELYELKNDEEMLKLIINKAKKLEYNYNVDSLKTNIQENIDIINNNSKITNEEFINISITESNNKVINIDIRVNIKNYSTDIINNVKLSIDMSQSNKLTVIFKDNDNNIKSNISYGYEENNLSINVETVLLDEQNNIKNDLFKMIYQINAYNENNIEQNSIMTYNSEENIKYQVQIKDTKKLKQDIQIEKLTNENMELLNSKSKEDLEKLFQAIIQRILYVYEDKLEDNPWIMQKINF